LTLFDEELTLYVQTSQGSVKQWDIPQYPDNTFELKYYRVDGNGFNQPTWIFTLSIHGPGPLGFHINASVESVNINHEPLPGRNKRML
jgi:hypothetical protein